MAYKELKKDICCKVLRKYFLVETRTEIATLPNINSAAGEKCEHGSQALCEEDGSVWYLAADDVTWKELT